jgi:hypothetical protein
MMGPAGRPIDITQTVRRFPEDADLVARLVAEDETFRTICEDYNLALMTLHGLEAQHQTRDSAAIADYRALILELEREIGGGLEHAKSIGVLR